MALKEHEGKTIMYVAMGSEWRQFGHPKKKRPIQSVILDAGISERILNDCKDFINTPSWYSDRGKNFTFFLKEKHSLFCILSFSYRNPL